MKSKELKQKFEKNMIDEIVFSGCDTTEGILFDFIINNESFIITNYTINKGIGHFTINNNYIVKSEDTNFEFHRCPESGAIDSRISLSICKEVSSISIESFVTKNTKENKNKKSVIEIKLSEMIELDPDERYYGAAIFVASSSIPIIKIFDKPFIGTKFDLDGFIKATTNVVFDSYACKTHITTKEITEESFDSKMSNVKDMISGYYSQSSFVREAAEYDSEENPTKLTKYACYLNKTKYLCTNEDGVEIVKEYFKDRLVYISKNIELPNNSNFNSINFMDLSINFSKDMISNLTEKEKEAIPDKYTFEFQRIDKSSVQISFSKDELINDTDSVINVIKEFNNTVNKCDANNNNQPTVIVSTYIDIDGNMQLLSETVYYLIVGNFRSIVSLYDNNENIISSTITTTFDEQTNEFNSKSGIHYNMSIRLDKYQYKYCDNDMTFEKINGEFTEFKSVYFNSSDILFTRNVLGIPCVLEK